VTITRRGTLWLLPALAQAVVSIFAASARPATAGQGDRAPAPFAEPKGRDITQRYLIVNADDFGENAAINRGIIEAHERGLVTSASLLLDAPGTDAAVALARQHPSLSLGLHVNLDRTGRGLIGQERLTVLAREIERQFDAFTALTGSHPTHIDSHHHVHRQLNVGRLFLRLSQRYGIPLRGFSDAIFMGAFYGRWEFGKIDRSHIGVDYLITLLGKVTPGFTEVACHPGYPDPTSDAGYNLEREVELRTLTDARAKAALGALGIRLVSYRDYRAVTGLTPTSAGALADCQTRLAR
jgi:predicted glycoside hydrolase/deacetylase ChbG (UPF0249 family)